MLPFTAEQFFGVFADYNRATWPAPALAYAAGVVMLAGVLAGRPAWAGRAIAAGLATLWLWTGLAYHWVHFAPVNPAARLFAVGFAAQAALFLWFGTVKGCLTFAAPRHRFGLVAGMMLVAYAALLYPWLGAVSGHRWPAAPTFGVTPCPLTIFTFGLLMMARGRVPAVLLVLPVLWAAIGGSAAVLLGVLPDWMLPVSAAAALALRWRAAAP